MAKRVILQHILLLFGPPVYVASNKGGKKTSKTSKISMSWVWTSGSLWIYQKWGVSACSLQVARPQTPLASLWAYCHTKRWMMEVQAVWAASRWDKAGPLLTRPRPSARILPPISIDYVVGGSAVSSVFVFFPCFTISALPGATLTDIQPSHWTTYLPLTAAFMDVLSSEHDTINDDSHMERDIV